MAEEPKGRWPEVVGMDAEEAKAKILAEIPDADIQIMPFGSPMTRDYQENRVRVMVDGDNKVADPPYKG